MALVLADPNTGSGYILDDPTETAIVGPNIDNIDTDNNVAAGQLGVVITGTNFGTVSAVTLGGEALVLA